MKKTTIPPLIMLTGILFSCAKSTKEIPPQYISPILYNSYTCQQIESEMHLLSSRVSEVGARVDRSASNDSAKMGVGLVLFWPTLFFLDGASPQAGEYARLRGEFEALEKVGMQKNCGINVAPEALTPLQKTIEEKYPEAPSTTH